MELIEKMKAIIGQLEEIKSLKNPNIDNLKEQISVIENEELHRLDDEFEELIKNRYDENKPDEKAEKLIDKIAELFLQADELISSIRKQFCIEELYNEEDFDDRNNGERFRSPWDDEDYFVRDEDDYAIVLTELSRSALKAIGIGNEDKRSVILMRLILIGIYSKESDDVIVGKAFAQITMSGFMLPMEDIKEMCKKTRANCQKQLFGLQMAFFSLRESHCSAEQALNIVKDLLQL